MPRSVTRLTTSPANSFAIVDSVPQSSPALCRSAACSTSRRIAFTSVAESAIGCCTAWKPPIGRPKAWRSFA